MKALRERMDRLSSHFEAGGRLERLGPVWEALDTLAYTPGEVTRTASHVRDGLDYKRLMTIVVIALPAACAARNEHELTGWPSSSTMHAPHSESSQPSFVPVRPISPRITLSRSRVWSVVTG